jgi:amphi-Trp domain-containing protein
MEGTSMGKETVLFKIEEKNSTRNVADLLRTFADKLETGSVTLKQGKKEVVLDIPEWVELEVKAEKEAGKKKVKKKIEFEIEWVVGDDKKRKANEPFSLG